MLNYRLFDRLKTSLHRDKSGLALKGKRGLFLVVLDLVLIATVTFVIVYSVTLAVQVSRGYSRTLPSPEWTVRLQIIDGSADHSILGRVIERVKSSRDENFEIEIVETSNFTRTSLPSTFVISRESDLQAARRLARRLGLESDLVSYEPLENNREHITATLILGTEAGEWLAAKPDAKEEPSGI